MSHSKPQLSGWPGPVKGKDNAYYFTLQNQQAKLQPEISDKKIIVIIDIEAQYFAAG